MHLVREAEVTLLQSPHQAELGSFARGKSLICAASALFACDFSGAVVATLRKPSSAGASFVTTDNAIVALTASTFRVYDARGKESRAFAPRGYHILVSASRDGSRMLTKTFAKLNNKQLIVWDMKREAPIATVTEKKAFVVAAALSFDGATVVHGGTDGVVRFYDVASNEHFAHVPSKGWIEAATASHDAFVTGGRAGIASVWNRDGTLRRALTLGAKIAGVAISHDARFVAAWGTHGAPRLWDLASDEALTIDDYERNGLLGGTRSIRFSRDGTRIVTVGNDCRVCVSKIEHAASVNS